MTLLPEMPVKGYISSHHQAKQNTVNKNYNKIQSNCEEKMASYINIQL